MTEIASLPQDAAMQAVRQMIVTHLVGMDEGPGDVTAKQLIDDLSEALHWDAQDADTDVDAELADGEALIRQALAEYVEAERIMVNGAEDPEGLVPLYRDLEAAAEASFSGE